MTRRGLFGMIAAIFAKKTPAEWWICESRTLFRFPEAMFKEPVKPEPLSVDGEVADWIRRWDAIQALRNADFSKPKVIGCGNFRFPFKIVER